MSSNLDINPAINALVDLFNGVTNTSDLDKRPALNELIDIVASNTGSPTIIVQDDGVALPYKKTLNFIGATITDDAANNRLNIVTATVNLNEYATLTGVANGLATKENTINAGTASQYFRGDKSFQTLDKIAVGLANVDNTTDLAKPVSTATQTALTNRLIKSGDTITGDIANTSLGFLQTASGTTAQRPATPFNGMLRNNTTALRIEFYEDGGWRNYARLGGDVFTGNIGVNVTPLALIHARGGNVTGIRIESTGPCAVLDFYSSALSYGIRTNFGADGIEFTRSAAAGGVPNTSMAHFGSTGNFFIGGLNATARLQVTNSTGFNQLRLTTPYTPTSSADTNGNIGDVAWDVNFIYIKTANSATGWKRSTLATF